MMHYLLLLFAALLLAGVFALNKLYQRQAGTSLKAGFRFNALVGLFTAAIFWCFGGFSLRVTPYSLILAIVLAVLGMSYTLLGFRILKTGTMAMYSLFLMVGGMAVPYVWGLLFLNEPFSLLRTAGLCLLIGAVALSNMGEKGVKLKVSLLLMCVTVFLLNGLLSVCSKLHQIESELATVSSTEFVVLVGLCKCALALLALLVTWIAEKKNGTARESIRPNWKITLPLILLIAVADGGSYFLQLTGAAELPATVMYPFITGGSMTFSTVVGIAAFREKPSKMLIVSVCLCFVGTLMFL